MNVKLLVKIRLDSNNIGVVIVKRIIVYIWYIITIQVTLYTSSLYFKNQEYYWNITYSVII